jgi:hypothetical protein
MKHLDNENLQFIETDTYLEFIFAIQQNTQF